MAAWEGHCQRCGKAALVHAMSYFCEEDCCLDCLEKESKHPRYAEARRVEEAHVRRGDYRFPGIGKPADL